MLTFLPIIFPFSSSIIVYFQFRKEGKIDYLILSASLMLFAFANLVHWLGPHGIRVMNWRTTIFFESTLTTLSITLLSSAVLPLKYRRVIIPIAMFVLIIILLYIFSLPRMYVYAISVYTAIVLFPSSLLSENGPLSFAVAVFATTVAVKPLVQPHCLLWRMMASLSTLLFPIALMVK